jgi:hypothetical protein
MKTKRREIKVWRIFRFQERFELPDDSRFCRKGPLMFIREYVGSGQNDEAINYKRQIAACKVSPHRHTLLAVFGDLREMAANYSRCFRGYILDERFEPASINKIAGWVGLNISEACKILKELEQIGLIEKISMPKFDPSLNELPKKDEEKDKEKKKTGGKKKDKKPESRAPTRKSEKKRAPLKNKDKSEIGNGKCKINKKTGNKPESSKCKEQISSISQLKSQDKQISNPTNNPKESDGEVGNNKLGINKYPPRQSFKQQYKQIERLGIVLHRLYNPKAKDFAMEVFNAIGTPYEINSKEGRSELACWMKAWTDIQLLGLNSFYLQELWDKTIAYAIKLRSKRGLIKWKRSPEALLRWMFNRYLNSINKSKEAEIECAKTAI